MTHGPGARRALACVVAAAGLAVHCAAPQDDSVTLRFWAMGREGEVVQELVRDFEREHGNVRVEVQQIPWTAAHEKLLTAYVGGSTPDLAQLGNTWIAEFAALRAVEPLDSWLSSSPSTSSGDYFPGIWETNVVNGEAHGVPWYVDTRLLFYRRDILAAAGYDSMPATWDGWVEAMTAVKRTVGDDGYAILLPTNEFMQPVVLGLQTGSSLLVDDGTRGGFSQPAFRRAFDFYVSLFERELAPPVTNAEISNLYQEFARGYFAMYITGPWNLGEFARRLPDELQSEWATAPLPGPEGAASGVSFAGGSSLVMFRGSKHKEEAWALIEFLSRPEQQVRFWRLTGDLPARRESWADSALASDPRVRAFETQLRRVLPAPRVPEWEQIAVQVQIVAEEVIRGSVSTDSALARLDRDVDRMLAKRRWLHERAQSDAQAASQP